MASIWNSSTSGDWSPGLWTGGVPNATTTDATIALAGAYTVSIATGESFAVQGISQSGGTLSISGTLTLAGSSSDIFSNTTINAGGVLSGTGVSSDFSNDILNNGLVQANGGTLQIIGGTFDNRGTLAAINGGLMSLAAASMPGQTGTGTLNAGTYLVSGNGSAINLYAFGGQTGAVIVNNATITLDGLGANLYGYDSTRTGQAAFVLLEQSLQTIGATGVLTLAGARNFASTSGASLTDQGLLVLTGGTVSGSGLTIAAGGTVSGTGAITEAVTSDGTLLATGGGTLALAGGYSGSGGISIDAGNVLALGATTLGAPVTNNGTFRATSGTVTLTAGISGTGQLQIASGAVLDLSGNSAMNAAFSGASAVLKLENPSGYTGTLIGFETTDTLDLTGISATATTLIDGGHTLSVTTTSGTLTFGLNTDYTGRSFSITPDGNIGSNITVGGVDYAFEGSYFTGKTISWSFAASNLSADGGRAVFSSFFASPGDDAYKAVVQSALAAWASVTGINFVQVADTATTGIRVGWGDFTSLGGEIGEANITFNAATNVVNPDIIVRLQDPAGLALDSSNIYQGTQSSLFQIAVHEIGHALGLDHSTDTSSVMYPSASTLNRTLDVSDIAGITSLFAATACYARGTRVLTSEGEVAVEALRPGDRVPGLVSGQMRTVHWIGHRSVAPERHPRPHDLRPVRVRAHAFGPCAPVRDLILSPDHAVFADGVLVPVRYLLNGATVVQERADEVTYFHIELADAAGHVVHDVVLAEGLPAESYLDTGNRGAFANADGPVMTHPDFALRVWDADACAPLHTEGAVVTALRTRLHARAEAIGFALAADPDLHLMANGRRVNGAWNGATWRAHLTGGPVTIASRSAAPAETDLASLDARCLGVLVAAITLNGAPIALDDPRLGAGWHAPEDGWRWTAGAAALTLPAGELALTIVAAPSTWTIAQAA